MSNGKMKEELLPSSSPDNTLITLRVDSVFWGCWLASKAVSTCRIRALDICYCLTVSRAAQRSVYAPAFSPHLAKLECDVCVLSASLATAVVSVSV